MTPLEALSLAALCFAGAASPGPSLAVVLACCRSGGRSHGVIAAWAHASGVAVYALMTVFGFSAIVTARPALFTALQLAGAAYLLWLAVGLLRGGKESEDPAHELNEQGAFSAAADGFAVAFLNPKLAVFMLALFSQFIRPDASPADNALLVLIATVVDGLWYTLIALLFTREAWLAALNRHARIVDKTFAVLLAGLAIYILYGAVSAQ